MDSKKQLELIEQLAEICSELGWAIAVPADDETEIVDGLLIGKEEYLAKILQALGSDYDVFTQDENEEIEETVLTPLPKKKVSYH